MPQKPSQQKSLDQPWRISDEAALKEIAKWRWKLRGATLKPALVRREDLLREFEVKHSSWHKHILSAGLSATKLALSGPLAFDAIRFIQDSVALINQPINPGNAGKLMGKAVGLLSDKAKSAGEDGAAEIVATSLVEANPEKSTSKLATSLVGNFLTVVVAVATGAGASVIAPVGVGIAFAFIVWLSDREAEKEAKRAVSIVNDMYARYKTLRADRQHKIYEKPMLELAALVKSNAKTDWQDDNETKTLKYYDGNLQWEMSFNLAGYTSAENQLRSRIPMMSKLDKSGADLAELVYTFHEGISKWIRNFREGPIISNDQILWAANEQESEEFIGQVKRWVANTCGCHEIEQIPSEQSASKLPTTGPKATPGLNNSQKSPQIKAKLS